MAELRESSGLHSLASLREHEKRQALRQAEAARARAEAEQRARHDAARIEHERQLAERAASEYAESAHRAELLRLENAQRAALERAEKQTKASEELKSELERERTARQSVELGLTSQLLRQRLWTSLLAALCVSGALAALGLYFGALRPSAERTLATAQQALFSERRARSEAREGEARSLLRAEELGARVNALEQTLRTERERWATEPPVTNPVRRPTTREPLRPPPKVKPCRDDGDPLNPCLKR